MNKDQGKRKLVSRKRRQQMRDAIAFSVVSPTPLRAGRHIDVQFGKPGSQFLWAICSQEHFRHWVEVWEIVAW